MTKNTKTFVSLIILFSLIIFSACDEILMRPRGRTNLADPDCPVSAIELFVDTDTGLVNLFINFDKFYSVEWKNRPAALLIMLNNYKVPDRISEGHIYFAGTPDDLYEYLGMTYEMNHEFSTSLFNDSSGPANNFIVTIYWSYELTDKMETLFNNQGDDDNFSGPWVGPLYAVGREWYGGEITP